jgi:hypothetical protein
VAASKAAASSGAEVSSGAANMAEAEEAAIRHLSSPGPERRRHRAKTVVKKRARTDVLAAQKANYVKLCLAVKP